MKIYHYCIKKKIPTLLLFFIVLLSIPVSAQNLIWQPLKKPGGELMSSFISISKDSLVAATHGGVYLSINGGESWQRFGLKNVSTGSIYRHKNSALFVETHSSIHRKTDMNGDWVQLPSTFDGTIIFITGTTKDILFATSYLTTYKSTDLGDTWHAVTGMAGKVSSIVELTDGTLFASVEDDAAASGIYRSDDNGETWQQIGLAGMSIPTLSKNSKDELFAGCNTSAESSADSPDSEIRGLYKSTDLGKTWERIVLSYAYSLVVDANNVFYMCEFMYSFLGFQFGYWTSSDGGNHWSHYHYGIDHPGAKNLILAPDGYLYLYGETLLYRTIEPVISGITNVSSLSFSVYPNPFTDKLQINGLPSERATISISDLLGREVYRGVYTGDAINLSHLLPGVYILNVKADGKSGAYKIVKQ